MSKAKLLKLLHWNSIIKASQGRMIVIGTFLTAIVIGSFSFLLWKRVAVQEKRIFLTSLILKLLAGISLGLIYTYYYFSSDTLFYFNDALKLASITKTDWKTYLSFLWSSNSYPEILSQLFNSESRSLFFVKLLSIVTLFSFGNYWIASLWFSFFSFLGSWFLFIQLVKMNNDFFWPAAISFLFLPSCLLWTSGILKESIAFGSVCFLTGYFLLLYNRQKLSITAWLVIFLCSYFLWWLKYYWAALLFPTMITSLMVVYIKPSSGWSGWKEISIWMLIFLSLCIGVSFVHPNFYFHRILNVIVENHNVFLTISEDRNVIHYNKLSPTFSSILINSPLALFSGLFRPAIFEASAFFKTIESIQNLVFLILFVFSLKNPKIIFYSEYRLLIVSAVVYSIILCVFLALSTPNFGTLSRYRVGFLSFFVFLISCQNPFLHQFKLILKKWNKFFHINQ